MQLAATAKQIKASKQGDKKLQEFYRDYKFKNTELSEDFLSEIQVKLHLKMLITIK